MTKEDKNIYAGSQNNEPKIELQNQRPLTDTQWIELRSVFFNKAITESVVYTITNKVSGEEDSNEN